MASPALYDPRQLWKPLFYEIAWHAVRKAVLYALAFAAVFLAAAYDYRWFAEIEGWIETNIGGSFSGEAFCVPYVIGGLIPAVYIGLTNGIADKADRIGELIRQTSRPLLEHLAKQGPAGDGIPIESLKQFLASGDAAALAGSPAPMKQLHSVGAALRSRPLRTMRTFLTGVAQEFEVRGATSVTPLQFAEAALPRLPDFVATEAVAHWRTGRYVAWVLAAVWLTIPIALTHAIRNLE